MKTALATVVKYPNFCHGGVVIHGCRLLYWQNPIINLVSLGYTGLVGPFCWAYMETMTLVFTISPENRLAVAHVA